MGRFAAFYALDAAGEKHLFTCQDDTPERRASFRRHMRDWEQYTKTAAYRAKVPPIKWPVYPLKMVVEP